MVGAEHLVAITLESFIVLLFSVYILYKGIKQKSYPKVTLGVAFASGFLGFIFSYMRELTDQAMCHSLFWIFTAIGIFGYFYIFLMLILGNRKRELLSTYIIVIMFLLALLLVIDHVTLGSLVNALIIATSVVLIPGFGYLYYQSKDRRALMFFISMILLGVGGMYSRIDPFITSNLVMTIAFALVFVSFEFQSLLGIKN
jgi:hypothetical protein